MKRFLLIVMIIVSVFACRSKSHSVVNESQMVPTNFAVQASLDSTLTTFSIVSSALSNMTLVDIQPQFGQTQRSSGLVVNVSKVNITFTATDMATSAAVKCQVLIPLVTDPATNPMPTATTAACVPA